MKSRFTRFELPEKRIKHDLSTKFDHLQKFQSRRQLQRSLLYRQHQQNLSQLNGELSWSNYIHHHNSTGVFRVVAWNLERGINLDGIINSFKKDPWLQQADILLLTETDIGMGRSGNRNVPEALAAALKMNFCYANMFLSLARGDEGEQHFDAGNSLALHGISILSRYRFTKAESRPLPLVRDEFESIEKIIGQRNALQCCIEIGDCEVAFAVAHLDVKASSQQRATQLTAALQLLEDSGVKRQIFGGDLNTHTYDMRTRFHLLCSLLYKAAFIGVREAVSHYMIPEQVFERPVFEVFREMGFKVRDFTPDREGTLVFDLNELTLNLKTQKWLPFVPLKWMLNLLKPWNGRVPLRLDWLAGKNVSTRPFCEDHWDLGAKVLQTSHYRGRRLSDHFPIVADICL